MSEKSFWVLIRTSLKLKMYRVENRVMKGMPDIHYVKNGKSGWIELKYLANWPKTRVTIGLKKNQVFWLKEYGKNKGKCWVLVRIDRDYMGLYKGEDAEKLYLRPSKKDFVEMAHWHKKGNMKSEDWSDLVSVITS